MSVKIDLNQKNYLHYSCGRQIFLPLDYELHLPADAEARLVDAFVNRMDLSALYATYGKLCPDDKADAAELLKVCLYACSDISSAASVRAVEEKCRYDDRYRFLLNGKPAPDHSTISRFRSHHLRPCIKELLAAHVKVLFDLKEVDGSILFQDGTKIRANANKYTFVWKGSVSKYLEKLALEMLKQIPELEKKYDLDVRSQGNVIDEDSLTDFLQQLDEYQIRNKIQFITGSGHKKPDFQKDYEKYVSNLTRIRGYIRDLEIMGDRNSYSRTDLESTFMRDKDDHMRNGQLIPAFNLQHIAQGGYVLWVMEIQKTNDMYAVIPMINEIRKWLPFLKMDKYCADAGYECEDNYDFLQKQNITAYIKPSNYEKSQTKAFKNDIGLIENMTYNAEKDLYICAEGKEIRFIKKSNKKNRGGHISEISHYECSDCAGCPRKKECIKGNNSLKPLEERSKNLKVSKLFQKYRAESLERITSELGKKIRMNRSIQIEGSFGNAKWNHGMTRYRNHGLEKVLTESVLMIMALNIKKLHNRIQNEQTGKGLYDLKDEKKKPKKTAAEKNYERIMNDAVSRCFDKAVNDCEEGKQIELECIAETEKKLVNDHTDSTETSDTNEPNKYDELTLSLKNVGDYNGTLVEERKKTKNCSRRKKEPARRTPHENELDENLVDEEQNSLLA